MSAYRDFAGVHERRRYMRFPVDYLVKVSHQGVTIDASLMDMSLNGVFVNTSFRVPLFEQVDITIYDQARPAQTCSLKGKVVRATESGLALRLEKTLLEV